MARRKKGSKIIRPFKNFDGSRALELNDKDYYPERWTVYNHLNDRIKLESTVFKIDFRKNTEILQNYILYYFDAVVLVNQDIKPINEKIYVFKKDYILPPFLIYYSYLKLDILVDDIVFNNVEKVFRVSKSLNYMEFLEQSDFGLFSKIFSFTSLNKKHFHADIFIKSNSSEKKKITENSFIIDATGGKFCNIGGYEYSFKQYIKSGKIKIKKSIKKYFIKNKH